MLVPAQIWLPACHIIAIGIYGRPTNNLVVKILLQAMKYYQMFQQNFRYHLSQYVLSTMSVCLYHQMHLYVSIIKCIYMSVSSKASMCQYHQMHLYVSIINFIYVSISSNSSMCQYHQMHLCFNIIKCINVSTSSNASMC